MQNEFQEDVYSEFFYPRKKRLYGTFYNNLYIQCNWENTSDITVTGKTHFNSNWEIWVIRTIQLNITWYILYIPVYIYIYHNCTWDNIHLNTKCMGQSHAKYFVTVSGTIHPNSIKNGTIHPNSYWEQMVIPLIAMVVYNVQYLQSPS